MDLFNNNFKAFTADLLLEGIRCASSNYFAGINNCNVIG